ncbi:LamG-like jellyroll fold domain-containing protein [Streptomyces sp. NPDC060322]|uniref:LamG-like jellyroll fold domain-containing protein n=1 Tax=Streptomyces sp. NPDC060322 TaxID=3347097 RepID=UPI003665941C
MPVVSTRTRAVLAGLGLLLSCLAVPTLAAPPATASGSAPSGDALTGTEQILFRSGTGGYGCFRIPALVRTATNALLAFAEARRSPSCADRGPIDLVLRRSTNDGRTWSPVRVVTTGSPEDPHAPYTHSNPAPVADLVTGDVLLLSTSEPVQPGGTRTPRVQRSTDDGLTFGAARPLPRFAATDKGWYGTGPGHGVQLTSGAHPGRLVVGAYQEPDSSTAYIGVLYSDDGGENWQASTTPNSHVKDTVRPGEPTVAELDDGSLYVNARNNVDPVHRTRAVSTDGGTTVPAQRPATGLTTPQVQGSVLALRQTYRSTPGDTLVFAAPTHPTDRQEMGLRWSTDRGVTWQQSSRSAISDNRAGYSDLAELVDGQIGLLHEGGTDFSAAHLYFNRFTPSSVGVPGTAAGPVHPQPTPAAGRTTPDTGPDANDAYLAGDATLGPGRFQQALVLDGAGDHAELPYAPPLDPGAGDVTYSFFFRHTASATSPQQALMWAYGTGSAEPQLWIRAQPAQDRLFVWAQTASGTTGLALPDTTSSTAFGDGAWHQLALVRTAGQLTLSVDGAPPAVATGVTGSLTGPLDAGVDGIRLGAKADPTASDSYAGALDGFRVHRAALTSAQLAALRTADSAPGTEDTLSAHLPFQVIDRADAPAMVPVGIQDDVSGHCADGTLLDGLPAEAAGRVGRGSIGVSATRPGVETPYVPSLDVGSSDFTYTLWFAHSATDATPNAALLWAYGSTSGKPSVWVRTQPAQDRLLAWAQTPEGHVQLTLPDPGSSTAYGDGDWHLLALSRTGGTLRLSVDGGPAVEASGLSGSLTGAAAEGLRVGSKPDRTDVLNGRLDDVRLFDRALTPAELTTVAASTVGGTGGYPADRPRVWWSMEPGNTEVHQVQRSATGPATPDSSSRCNHAYVRGSATTGGGRFGSALTLDGTDDGVELPYGADEALGADDFTVALWWKYSATPVTGDQVLLWAYGTGGAERQLWLRARPSQDRLTAHFQTDGATTELHAVDTSAVSAFGNSVWHHVVLQRSGDRLSLSVDGTVLDESDAASGAVTYGDAFEVSGIHLGTRPNGAEHLKGSLDEFVLVRRALTAAELTALRTLGADPGTATVARLPFETVTATGPARM